MQDDKSQYSATPQAAPVVYGNTYAQPTYVAQPAGQNVTYATTAAPQQIYVQHATPHQGNALEVRRPPPYRWADSICDWPKNLFPSCYCVCCFFTGIYITAQMAQKTGYMSFRTVCCTYFAFWIIALIIQLLAGGGVIIWIPFIVATTFQICLRLHIVRRDNITECGSNPQLGECCCGFWCWYCSVAQMARHIYGYSKVLDGDGDIDRPDGYGPMNV